MLFWFRWARKTDYTITASELFRTAVRDQFRGANNCNDCGIIEGGSVDAETSVTSVCGGGRGGGDFGVSLFALAVLSGDKDAVCWIANFYRENVGPAEVRRVGRNLKFHLIFLLFLYPAMCSFGLQRRSPTSSSRNIAEETQRDYFIIIPNISDSHVGCVT